MRGKRLSRDKKQMVRRGDGSREGSTGGSIIDKFVIPSAWCIVGCVAAKQTRAKHIAHVEAVSVAMEAVSFSAFQILYET